MDLTTNVTSLEGKSRVSIQLPEGRGIGLVFNVVSQPNVRIYVKLSKSSLDTANVNVDDFHFLVSDGDSILGLNVDNNTESNTYAHIVVYNSDCSSEYECSASDSISIINE